MRFRSALALVVLILCSFALAGCRNGPFQRRYYCQPVCQPVTQGQPVICCP